MKPSYYICQATIPNIEAIIQFEKYQNSIQNQDCYILEFPLQNYISLQNLIELILNDQISLNIQQVVTIIDHILNHLKQLFDKIKSTHGDLVEENIFICMQNISKIFNLTQGIIEIQGIHFVNYKQYFQLNRKKDFQDIKTIIISLLSSTRQEQQIEDLIQQISNIDSINDLINLIKNLSKQYSAKNIQNFYQDQKKIHHPKIIEKMKKIQQQLFQKWDYFDSIDYEYKEELQKIYQFLLSLYFTISIKNIYCSNREMRINLNQSQLEHQVDKLLKNSKNKRKLLEEIMNLIQQIIQNQYEGQVNDQKTYQENHNLKLGILNQKQVANIFYLLLCQELVERPDFTQNLKQIVKNIEIQLKNEIKLYQKYEIKIKLCQIVQMLI